MPPINNQGSRATLTTALVAFVILFIASLAMAFHFYGASKHTTEEYEAYKSTYARVVAQNQATGPAVTGLLALKEEAQPKFGIVRNEQETAIDVANKAVAGLVQVIGGTPDTTASAAADLATKSVDDAKAALVKAKVKTPLTATNLIAAVVTLTQNVGNKQAEVDRLQADLDRSQKDLTAARANFDKVAADSKKALENQTTASAAAQADLNGQVEKINTSFATVTSDQTAAGQKYASEVQRLEGEVAAAKAEADKANKNYNAALSSLQRFRPNTENSIIQQVDGHIARVPGNGVCYIDLGYGDHITKGLTFEVYSQSEGVPPLPAAAGGDEPLPVGKASIEVIEVGAASSECRIVKTTPGAVLGEGDLLVNLVYDAHTKPKFFVYGNFDLAQTGRPNPADGEVVKRLITQWGGALTEKVNVDTDYVILGSEPTLPNFNKADMTPEETQKMQQAQDALEKYTQLRNDSARLGIPILNQNRFLYYVGYFDQAKR